ncbi:MAG: UDP-N-acetylglucosamine diphosphorylase [Verrucomicrobiota bacterium]
MIAADFFDWPASLETFAADFPPTVAPWAWLTAIGPALRNLPVMERHIPAGVHVEGAVWIDPTVKLPSHATIIGPCWIGAGTEIRPGAYIRGNVIVGAGCVLGNACEFKNCLLLDGVQAPHFNYVGDSILGNRAHLGAGVICSNLRLDGQPVTVRLADRVIETGLRKFGAILGDHAEVGCNAVLNPGSVLGRRALVAPLTSFSGVLPADTIARQRGNLSQIPRRA